ncbi:hypothetical protein RB2083_1046 [Rhodobacteraceae bacterium HTCC2083]|jgi:hypothetical protein|nr:hypothetical protein RB2083_1046 [Rhodobacteraceae bacterium HTCC2083]
MELASKSPIAFLAFEHGQNIAISPPATAMFTFPIIKITRLTAHVDHLVYRASSPKNTLLAAQETADPPNSDQVLKQPIRHLWIATL